MFKTIDEKFAEIGFKKTYESAFSISYEKEETDLGYIHCIEIDHKKTGKHCVHSFSKEQRPSEWCSNGDSIGMTVEEMRLCIKKIKNWDGD